VVPVLLPLPPTVVGTKVVADEQLWLFAVAVHVGVGPGGETIAGIVGATPS
jgi:hypothetical protein